jgi:pteridine reductase
MKALPLAGRVALVTGAGLRVGRSIARALSDAGADLAIHFRESAGPATELATELRKEGRKATTVRGDLASPADCRTVIRDCTSTLGGLDVLVHSAANFHRASLEETDERLWDDAMNVNARAAFLLAREAAPTLRERRGRIVLMTDRMARHPPPSYLAHAVSKAAIEGLVRALAVELAPEVLVNGIAPGAVLVPEGTPPEQAERWARATPLGRLGDPQDVAATVVFLCAGQSYVTGQIIDVDGGQGLR